MSAEMHITTLSMQVTLRAILAGGCLASSTVMFCAGMLLSIKDDEKSVAVDTQGSAIQQL